MFFVAIDEEKTGQPRRATRAGNTLSQPVKPVGASLLAKGSRPPLGIWFYALSLTTIVGTPPGASPLPQFFMRVPHQIR